MQGLSHSGNPRLLEDILSETIPVYGRMVHGKSMLGDLTQKPMQYDVHGRVSILRLSSRNLLTYFFQSLQVVDREKLNKRLLHELETDPNVQIFYNHQLVSADFDDKKAVFKRTFPHGCSEKQPPAKLVDIVEEDIPVELVEVSFDQCIGADGAHSATRHQLTKHTRVDFQQKWIDTFWCEFIAPATAGGGYKMSPNHLHIWPHPEFMFFAAPDMVSFNSSLIFSSGRANKDIERNIHMQPIRFRSYIPRPRSRLSRTPHRLLQHPLPRRNPRPHTPRSHPQPIFQEPPPTPHGHQMRPIPLPRLVRHRRRCRTRHGPLLRPRHEHRLRRRATAV